MMNWPDYLSPYLCVRCSGTGWLQRATLFRRRIKSKPCPVCRGIGLKPETRQAVFEAIAEVGKGKSA